MLAKLSLATLALSTSLLSASFEVASIRPSAPGTRINPSDFLRDGPQLSPVTLTFRGATLKACIRWAWSIMESQVTGPGWLGTERFDITARAAVPATEAEFRLMMQTLLTERFGVQFHRQTKEQSVYTLSIGKNGPKFKESTSEGDAAVEPDQGRMSLAVRRAKISSLADLLSRLLFQPVIDQTGLTGYYDVAINVGKYLPQSQDGIPDIVGILTTGLQEELGLKLELKKLPLDLLIVDKADRGPSEN
jgi:uncharacterized protein (TIGR03435 family)